MGHSMDVREFLLAFKGDMRCKRNPKGGGVMENLASFFSHTLKEHPASHCVLVEEAMAKWP